MKEYVSNLKVTLVAYDSYWWLGLIGDQMFYTGGQMFRIGGMCLSVLQVNSRLVSH